jgi:pyruvate,water dikinase
VTCWPGWIRIREGILAAPFPEYPQREIREAYALRCKEHGANTAVAAEDFSGVSFASQQESFLNIHGELALLDACRQCYTSP